MDLKKILFVGYCDPWHSSAGGYDKITSCPDTCTLWDKQVPFGFIPMHKSGKVINTVCLDLCARLKRNKYDVIHYFYGDMLIFPFRKSAKHKVVATIHMDLNQRKRKPKLFIKTLKSLDGVVSLSSNQKKELEKLGINSVFIPHGFNKPTFKQLNTDIDRSKINIVVSGSNYRDVETLYQVVKHCFTKCPSIQFHLLGQPSSVKEELKAYSNTICYPRVDDDLYYSIISDCDYNFLPLTFSTANNALLEAQFLGVKSILPQIAGIEDYAAPAPLNAYYKTCEDLYNLFDGLSKNTTSEDIIKHAEKFLWENIYPQLSEFYKSL